MSKTVKSSVGLGGGRFKPYLSYKDSGVEWLGEIPAYWDVRRLKDYGKLLGGSGFPHEHQGIEGEELPFYKVGDLVHAPDGKTLGMPPHSISRRTALELRARVIPQCSIVYAKIGAALYLNRRRITPTQCCIDNNMTAYAPHQTKATSGWSFYWMTNLDFGALANPGAVPSLSEGYQSTLPLLVPPIAEQEYISGFLDWETAKIDALIAKKERLIELLQEKRTGLITQMVTKGLDPNVPMKDSGVEWLGEIPAHWDILQLRRAVNHFVDYRGATPTKTSHGVPLVTAGNVKNESIDFSLIEEFISEEDYDYWMVRGLPERGDVVVTTEAPLGESAQIIDTRVALAQRIILLKANKQKVTNDYLKYHFAAMSGKAELMTRATGSTALGIKASRLKQSLITVPPLDEQIEIADFIRSQNSQIYSIIDKIRGAIELVKEYRTALISAAVTGKINVRKLFNNGGKI